VPVSAPPEQVVAAVLDALPSNSPSRHTA
jgi:hypothetical protein